MEWFADWFDSPFYHILYAKRSKEEANVFIDNLTQYLAIQPNANFLDMGCGKGRHSIALATKGIKVVGVDLSAQSIQQACEESDGISNVSFFVHDMRKPLYYNYFDFIGSFFTSFGYFETQKEDKKVLQNMFMALKNKGILVIDFLNLEPSIAAMVEQENVTKENIHFMIKRQYTGTHFVKQITFVANTVPYFFEERVRAISLQQFTDYAKEIGFTVLTTFGNYNLEPWKAETSPRLIVVLQK